MEILVPARARLSRVIVNPRLHHRRSHRRRRRSIAPRSPLDQEDALRERVELADRPKKRPTVGLRARLLDQHDGDWFARGALFPKLALGLWQRGRAADLIVRGIPAPQHLLHARKIRRPLDHRKNRGALGRLTLVHAIKVADPRTNSPPAYITRLPPSWNRSRPAESSPQRSPPRSRTLRRQAKPVPHRARQSQPQT